MTYPQGRTPLTADDMARMHPSTWEAECRWQTIRAQQAIDEAKALRARVAKLETALNRLIEIAEQCDLPEWAGYHIAQARADLGADQ
jgi:uncharacterized membrane protein YccC